MSLLGTLQIANNSMLASQVGLQVAGNNISNANTPGYIRQQVNFTPASTRLFGALPIGLGVQVDGIVQQVDRFLMERLRDSTSDLENSSTQEQYHLRLEALIGELDDTDLSTALTDFFGSINDLLNQPDDVTLRRQAVLQGERLVADINRLDGQLFEIRSQVNEQVVQAGDEINRLLEEIARLNVQIVQTEGGGLSKSDAVGVRDQRETALRSLASLIGIRAIEQDNRSVTVYVGGDYLVFEGTFQPVEASFSVDDEIPVATINVERSDSPLQTSTGRLAGLYSARDEILGDFRNRLADFARDLTFEFNKVYSGGQGLSGFTELTSEHQVEDVNAALDQAGLANTPVNGSFQVQVRNTTSGQVDTTDILVDLNGLDNDTSLTDLTASLDAISGISATVSPTGEVQLQSDSTDLEFNFNNDTSGVLAALGVNVFFAGETPRELRISSALQEDASKFAASRGGVGNDADNAIELAGLGSKPLEAHDGSTVLDLYNSIISEATQSSATSQAVTEGFRVFHRTLEGQHLSVSGVSIDEETVDIITHQRVFQASARVVATISELLQTLINL